MEPFCQHLDALHRVSTVLLQEIPIYFHSFVVSLQGFSTIEVHE